MLTARAWWFIFWSGAFALMSVPWLAYYAPAVAVTSITLLLAAGGEAILFLLRTHNLPRRLNVTRTAIQGNRTVPMLWAGVPAKIKVRTVDWQQVARDLTDLEIQRFFQELFRS